MEYWADVPGFGGWYQASNLGEIRSKDRVVRKFSFICGKDVDQFYKGKILKQISDESGYRFVSIGVDKKRYRPNVGWLVLKAFVGERPDGMECCHNNGNPSDNRIENLRWDTHKSNNQDRITHGTYKRGSDHHFAKFDDDLKSKIANGVISKKDALLLGVSNTHYYRIRKTKIA